MKKHTLNDHYENVMRYQYEIGLMIQPWSQQQQVAWFTAYERWLNDRDLLTVENGHELEYPLRPVH